MTDRPKKEKKPLPEVEMLPVDHPFVKRADKFYERVVLVTLIIVAVVTVITLVCVPWDTTLAIAQRGMGKKNLPVWAVMPLLLVGISIIYRKSKQEDTTEAGKKRLTEGTSRGELYFGYVVVPLISGVFAIGQIIFAYGFFEAAGYLPL